VKLPTWGDLLDLYCASKYVSSGGNREVNPYYEDAASRRYNCSTYSGRSACRLVFLKGVLEDPTNKTLVRKGRFIWCRNLRYEGKNINGLRQVSFTVDKGAKRFVVAENNILCIPESVYINNNRFFRSPEKTFTSFSSVFSYSNALRMMSGGTELARVNLEDKIKEDSPYKPGTLVAPRLGYFHPSPQSPYQTFGPPIDAAIETEHPCGIILGPSSVNGEYSGREFYRVRFGHTTYERVHPIQLEIINEV